MRLVVGLGNPGARYARTRHNVAWHVLDALAVRHGVADEERHELYRARRLARPGPGIALIEPLTFMNASGEAVAAWQERHGLDPGDLLAVSDDIYLPVGMIRMRADGSSGGHRGLESVAAAMGGTAWARLRVGVGAAAGAGGVREHVLEEFTPDERPAIEEAIRLAADAVDVWASEGTLSAMNRFNRKVREEESET